MRAFRFVLLLAAIALAGTAPVRAISSFQFVTSTVQVAVGGSPANYNVTGGSLDFSGHNFGTLTIGSDSLTLVGGQAATLNHNFGDPLNIYLNYRVYATGDTPGGFATASFSISGGSSPNLVWENYAVNFNLLTGISAQGSPVNYTIELYFDGADLGNTVATLPASTATFTVAAIPEPANAVACCGALAFLGAFLRRSFSSRGVARRMARSNP